MFRVLLLVVSLYVPAHPWFFSGAVTRGVAVTDTTVVMPTIGNIVGESMKQGGAAGEGGKRLLGTFSVYNAARTPFLLRLLFGNGGRLRYVEGDSRRSAPPDTSSGVSLDDLTLRYRDATGSYRDRELRNTEYRGGGYLYEVMFFDEDMQDLYEMELWGVPNKGGGALVGGRTYRESVRVEIEKL